MKILKAGKLPKDKIVLQGTCSNCECEVGLTKAEIDNVIAKALVPLTFVRFACPTQGCGFKIKIQL